MPQKPYYDTKLNMGVIPTKSEKENKGLKLKFCAGDLLTSTGDQEISCCISRRPALN